MNRCLSETRFFPSNAMIALLRTGLVSWNGDQGTLQGLLVPERGAVCDMYVLSVGDLPEAEVVR